MGAEVVFRGERRGTLQRTGALVEGVSAPRAIQCPHMGTGPRLLFVGRKQKMAPVPHLEQTDSTGSFPPGKNDEKLTSARGEETG